MIFLNRAFLCPGSFETGPHVTENNQQCECGNTSLVSLSYLMSASPRRHARHLEFVLPYKGTLVNDLTQMVDKQIQKSLDSAHGNKKEV